MATTDEITTCSTKSFVLQQYYTQAPETRTICLAEGCKIEFVQQFKYLGSLVNFQLTDSDDIRTRIKKASMAMGALNFIWKLPAVELHTKILL